MSLKNRTTRQTETVTAYLSSVRLRSLVTYLKPLIGLLLLWELVAQLSLIPQQALPHTYEVGRVFMQLTVSGELVAEMGTTAHRALLALAIATVVGVAIGLMMNQYRPVEWFFDPIVSLLFPMPKVILVPIYLLWFGFGTRGIVLLAATSAVFPVIIATYDGTRSVDKELIWSARSMGMSKLQTTWKIVMPAALPSIFNGLNIALFSAIIVTLVSEMLTSAGGLGQLLVRSLRFFDTPRALVAVIAAVMLGLVINRLFTGIRSYTLRWADETGEW